MPLIDHLDLSWIHILALLLELVSKESCCRSVGFASTETLKWMVHFLPNWISPLTVNFGNCAADTFEGVTNAFFKEWKIWLIIGIRMIHCCYQRCCRLIEVINDMLLWDVSRFYMGLKLIPKKFVYFWHLKIFWPEFL